MRGVKQWVLPTSIYVSVTYPIPRWHINLFPALLGLTDAESPESFETPPWHQSSFNYPGFFPMSLLTGFLRSAGKQFWGRCHWHQHWWRFNGSRPLLHSTRYYSMYIPEVNHHLENCTPYMGPISISINIRKKIGPWTLKKWWLNFHCTCLDRSLLLSTESKPPPQSYPQEQGFNKAKGKMVVNTP